MTSNKIEIYLHFVWATWNREEWLFPHMTRHIYRVIENEARAQGCNVLAINGRMDHIHVLTRFPATITIANCVKQMKGVSSLYCNKQFLPTPYFKWQGSYGAFSIGRAEVDEIIAYIRNQQHHHADSTLRSDLEECCEYLDDGIN